MTTSSTDVPFDFDTSLTNAATIWTHIIAECHLRGCAFLLVDVADFALVHLPAEVLRRRRDPTLHPPDNEAHFAVLARAYARECDLTRALKLALLKYLETASPDVYTDCLTLCGGAAKFHTLTIPQITDALRAEIVITDEGSQVTTLATLTNEGINLTDPSPLRALEARVLLLIIELGRTGYVLPAADLLRRVRGMFLLHTLPHQQPTADCIHRVPQRVYGAGPGHRR